MMANSKVALVFGASGVSGWSFVNEVLNDYPKKDYWGGVIAMTNRPLDKATSLWPRDSRLSVTSGVDLLEGELNELQDNIGRITGIDQVTHVFYVAYKANSDNPVEVEENVAMFKRAVTAVDKLCPKLEWVVNQTGSKNYGCHLLRSRPDHFRPPFPEDHERLTGDQAATLFYYPQIDWLREFAATKAWSWCETRPDIIIGFVPNQNFYSLGMAMGFFFSLYREINGEGAECPFPGTEDSWNVLCHDSSADMIARQTIYVCCVNPNTAKGAAFNVADERSPHCWRNKWDPLCRLFGLRGVKLSEDNPIEVRKYIKDNQPTWQQMEAKYGLRAGHCDNEKIFPGFEYFLLTQFDTDRHFDMSKMYDGAGFREERKASEAWGGAFERMKAANLIPKSFT